MKVLVRYVETVLSYSTISQSVYPVRLSGVTSVYGKENDNTAAVIKTFL
jgi:hypothetical protein